MPSSITSMLFKNEIIPRRTLCCAKGEESLWKRDVFFSVLEKPEKEALTRHDFCVDCWSDVSVHKQFPHHIAYWKVSRKPTQKKPSSGKERQERALLYLRHLLHEGEEKEKALVCALYLQREKRLTLRGEKEGVFLFEEVEREEMLLVPRVDLPKESLDLLRREVAKAINGDV